MTRHIKAGFLRVVPALLTATLMTCVLAGNVSAAETKSPVHTPAVTAKQVTFGTIKVDDLNIAYREAGDPNAPKLVLLHGFPSSSHQYRNLIQALSGRFHVIAPDYQGFGNSDVPDPATYAYTFDGISETMEKFLAAKGFDHLACSFRTTAARLVFALSDGIRSCWIG